MKTVLITILLSLAVLAGCATPPEAVDNTETIRLKTKEINKDNVDYWAEGVHVVWVNKPKEVK